MPLRLSKSPGWKATISFNAATGWKITSKGFGVLFSATKTHFGLPLFRIDYDPPIEMIPGQTIRIAREPTDGE